MQQSRVIPSPRSFACDLATLCAPTLAGLKCACDRFAFVFLFLP